MNYRVVVLSISTVRNFTTFALYTGKLIRYFSEKFVISKLDVILLNFKFCNTISTLTPTASKYALIWYECGEIDYIVILRTEY